MTKKTHQVCSPKRSRIAVIGTGMVGSTFAYAAMLKGLAAELVLIDVSHEREMGEVMDLSHGLMGTETGGVVGGDFKDCREADIVVITAGAAQKPGETRLDLVGKNIKIMRSIIKKIKPLRKDTVVLVVSNPVDILTWICKNELGLPAHQVIGSGTSLDTSRLRYNLSQATGVNLHNCHGYVMGEHGDSEFIPWSVANITAIPAKKLLTAKQMKTIEKKTREAAYEIIKLKQATYYGIGEIAAELCESIIHDSKRIYPVSTEPGSAYGIKGISLGVPAVLGRCGVEKVWKLPLNKSELGKLKKSAKLLKKTLKDADK